MSYLGWLTVLVPSHVKTTREQVDLVYQELIVRHQVPQINNWLSVYWNWQIKIIQLLKSWVIAHCYNRCFSLQSHHLSVICIPTAVRCTRLFHYLPAANPCSAAGTNAQRLRCAASAVQSLKICPSSVRSSYNKWCEYAQRICVSAVETDITKLQRCLYVCVRK